MCNKLQEIRELLCIDVEEIAKLLNMPKEKYLVLEKDIKNMTVNYISILSTFFDISADFIIGLKENPISIEFKNKNLDHTVVVNEKREVIECNYESWCNPLIVKYCEFSSKCLVKNINYKEVRMIEND